MIQIVFTLNEKSELIFTSEGSLENLLNCDMGKINFSTPHFHVLLRDDFICEGFFILRHLLQEALHNELQLHESITNDIGLMWNKELHRDLDLVYEKCEGQQFWVGQRNLAWSTPGNVNPRLSTWVYNDKNGNIIFEITPNYRWHFVDPLPEEKDYISYEEFMKNYEPLVITTVSKKVAHRWLEQIDALLEMIEHNEQLSSISSCGMEK